MGRFAQYVTIREADSIDDMVAPGSQKIPTSPFEGTSGKLNQLIKLAWDKYKTQTLSAFRDIADKEGDREMQQLISKIENEGDAGDSPRGPTDTDDFVKMPSADSGEGDDNFGDS